MYQDEGVPGEDVPEETLTPRQRILRSICADAPPPLENMYISCGMHVASNTSNISNLVYDMRITLNRTSPPRHAQWHGALGSARVLYYTERSITSDSIIPVLQQWHPLRFSDNRQMAAEFCADMSAVTWEEFLIVAVEFPENTIRYTIDEVNNPSQQTIRPLRIRNMQRVYLQTRFSRNPSPGPEDSDSIYGRVLLSAVRLLSSSESSAGSE